MADQTQNSYLENLKFNPELTKSPIAKYLGNLRLVMLMLIIVLVSGIYSYINLPRELNPSIDIALITVNTVYPGAGPEEVESLITEPIEEQIERVDGVTTYTSTSQDSVSTIIVEFEDSFTRDDALTEVQNAVDAVTGLPEDATDPRVNDIDFADIPIWVFSLSAGNDIPGLDRFSQRLQDRLEANPSIDRVVVSGLQNREIQIIVTPEKITELGLNYIEIQNTVSSALTSYPSGEIRTDGLYYSVSIDPTINSIEDIRSRVLTINSQIYTLSEIATVQEINSPDEGKSFKASPNNEVEQVVTFNVYKKPEAKIEETVLAAQDIIQEETAQFEHIQYDTVTNFAKEIDDQFSDLIRNFAQTVLLVFAVMLIFLGIREAFLATISIPLTVLIGITVMYGTGITLNFISIFSLLIALGMLVDNTVVVVSAVNSYFRMGKFTAYQTGLLVFKDFFIPLISTNLTTVWAFLPLLLATGIIGKFIEPIPIVVSTMIIASALVGFFLVLPISLLVLAPQFPKRVRVLSIIIGIILFAVTIYTLIPNSPLKILAVLAALLLLAVIPPLFRFIKNKTEHIRHTKFAERLDSGFLNLGNLGNWYRNRIESILNSKISRIKVVVAIVIFTLFTYSLPALGFVPNIFFPTGDADLVYISVEMPLGSGIQTTEAESARLLSQIREKEYIENAVAELGRAPQDTGIPSGDNLILITLNLVPTEERSLSSIEIAEELRDEFANYNLGDLSVIEQSGGPPAGADIEIKYSGPDLAQLAEYANKTEEYLATQDHVTNINQSIRSGTSKFTFIPDNKKLANYGLTERDIGLWLRIFASGTKIDEIDINNQTYDINFRVNENLITPNELIKLTIPTRQGRVSLQELGEFKLNPDPSIISREDGEKTISVTASVTENGNIGLIGQNLEQFADTELNLSDAYSWSTGGVNEENQRSVQSIIMAMGLSAILILVTLVIQLGSFRKAFIVMLVIPLALSGVFLLFALFQIPLSFPALIGMLALFGIVVNNSILIVEKINQNLAANIAYKESIADAVASRLEPIALTTMTTIIGLIPITLSDPFWRGLGGAIICGLTVSGTILLLFIPTVYYMLMASTEEAANDATIETNQ